VKGRRRVEQRKSGETKRKNRRKIGKKRWSGSAFHTFIIPQTDHQLVVATFLPATAQSNFVSDKYLSAQPVAEAEKRSPDAQSI
jgi:hypothetical protein